MTGDDVTCHICGEPPEEHDQAARCPTADDYGESRSMSDGTILGAEFATWANTRVGDPCSMCGAEIKYTPLGMDDGQSQHRLQCDCTVIECTSADG